MALLDEAATLERVDTPRGAIMQTPLRITFRHMEPSPAVEERIREYVGHLERFHERITGCHVVVERPAAHRHKGAPFAIKIDVTVPGEEIVVRSDRAEHPAHADVYVALHDAFDSARRILQDRVREQRGDVKRHAGGEPPGAP